MDKEIEFKELIDNIPKFLEYGSHAQLQISLPTTSHITLGETINIIQNQAREMGWPVENISVIKVGGYIICEECKKQAHIHISTPEKRIKELENLLKEFDKIATVESQFLERYLGDS